ncbi:MAG: transcription-repair coupling factor, partial [Opitutus sp.]|nr:transcription-repair coupling factor [Opitutus sp.]
MSSAPATAARLKLTGVCPAARACALARLAAARPAPVWLAVFEETRDLDALAEDVALFARTPDAAPALEVVVFPESQADSREMREAFHAASDRLAVLSKLRGRRRAFSSPDPLLVLTTPGALLQAVPPPADFSEREVVLRRGVERPFQALIDLLRQFDYDSEAVCEAPGQYAVRGGIVDIYPITAHQPYRLDFFGDTLEEIRTLDPVTQRSGEPAGSLTLTAAPQIHAARAQASLLDYLGPAAAAVLVEPKALEEAFDLLDNAAGAARFLPRLAGAVSRLVGLGDLDLASEWFDAGAAEETWDTESLSHHRSFPEENLLAHERLEAEDVARRRFFGQVLEWKRGGFAVDFIVSKEGEEQRVRELLGEDAELKKLQPRFVRGAVNEGFRITFGRANPPDEPPPATADNTERGSSGRLALPRSDRGYVAVTETEIFGRRRQRRAQNKRAVVTPSAVDQLLDFSELVEGDFVVHLQHGVAVYRGLTRLETADGVREVISLEFDDKVTLHVPLQESHLISRYVGLSKVKPQLGKVGSGRWEKVRAAAECATL